jgi:polysaccharide pyruvyl transferase WcaK-like protein
MKVLVYGWFHQGNIGDDLFIQAFQHLFPDFEFVFSENITSDKLQGVDVVFLGGGSFLHDSPAITPSAFKELSSKKVFYLGIGAEDHIHPEHLELLSRAKLVATRSIDQVDRLRAINSNVIYIPDLVYALQDKVQLAEKRGKSILIMPNVSVLPNCSSPHWKHAAWTYFKSEFCQFLDVITDNGWIPSFFSMCHAEKLADNWAANELIGHMVRRNNRFLLEDSSSKIEDVTKLISSYDLVITQRFHGIVLSEMTRTPYISIHHHDKLKFSQPGAGSFLSYYNGSKQSFVDAFSKTLKMKFTFELPVEPATFKAFTTEVINLL